MPRPSSNDQVSDFEPVTRERARSRETHMEDWDAGALQGAMPRRRREAANDFGVAPEITNPRAATTTAPVENAAAAESAPSPLRQEKWIQKRGHGLTYCGLFLFTTVLFFRPYEFLPFVPATLAFWIAVPTVLVFLFSQLALEGTLTARPREVNLILLFTLTALLSIPLATDRPGSWQTFNDTLLKVVLMFIVFVNAVRTERRLKWLLLLALGVSCYLSLNALNDYRLGRTVTEGYRVAGSLGGMFSNSNYLALHLVTILPITLGMLMSSRGPLRKLVYSACALLFTATIIVTFSRGAFLGLLGMGAVLAWKLGRRNRFAVVLLLLLMAPLFLLFAPGAYGDRIASIFNKNLDPNGSSAMRQAVFWRSVYVTIANPAFGVGIGNFHILSIRDLVSHNAYTQVSSEMGLAALAFYTAFIVTPLRRLGQIGRETFASRHDSKFYYLSVGLQASLVAYMISSFFASVAYEWYIYYLVGYAVALRRIYLSRTATDAATSKAQAAEGASQARDEETHAATNGRRAAYGGEGGVVTA